MAGLLFEPYVATQPKNWVPAMQPAAQAANSAIARRHADLEERKLNLLEGQASKQQQTDLQTRAFLERVLPAMELAEPGSGQRFMAALSMGDKNGATAIMNKTYELSAQANAAKQMTAPAPQSPLNVQPPMAPPPEQPKSYEEQLDADIEKMTALVQNAKNPDEAVRFHAQYQKLQAIKDKRAEEKLKQEEWKIGPPGGTAYTGSGKVGGTLPKEKEGAKEFEKFEELYPNWAGLRGSPEYAEAYKRHLSDMKPDSKSYVEGQVFDQLYAENKAKPENAGKSDGQIRLETYGQIEALRAGAQRTAAPTTQLLGPSVDEQGNVIPGSYDVYDPIKRKVTTVKGGAGFIGSKGVQRLPAASLDTLGSLNTTLQDVGKVREAWNEGLTGAFQGRANEALQNIRNHPAFETLRRRVNRLITVAYALSGKQISEKEMKILEEAILPSVKQMDQNFLVSVTELEDWLSRNLSNKEYEYKASGYHVPDRGKASPPAAPPAPESAGKRFKILKVN